MSQQEEQEEQEEPHQNIPEGSILEVLNLTHRLIPSPLPPTPSPTVIISTPPMLTLYDPTFLLLLNLGSFLDYKSLKFDT